MIFFPAIDLKDGQCVRLFQGDMDQVTVFGDDPAGQAKGFADAGAKWLHVVDLNGAFSGRPVNEDAVSGILDRIDIPVQLGGGIRDMQTIDFWLDRGVRRVILGTVAVRDPDLVKQACKRHPDRVVVGIDARDGMVAVEGWTELSEITGLELAKEFEDCGVAAIIYTDIARDGAMDGPNIEATVGLANAVSVPVIASGGVSSLEDLEALKATGTGLLEGVISGRALYDGRIDLAAAVELLN
ncbi:MAG TPA: 1-(5-phosphoribosyl)-5-[(5-phosphoribosylamino)methylideneamino]imidazole-4-carboxamide isomerase [Rhodospirillales bacterium]|jgi:phosphoribosylformimino-5-aminoimidazole carboxamide ribotide isomerase|nr:MAG: 1-(5-phosphoribosyl)-5-[(5-phosphoribosylamino)methylideneamino] imidazole-4-carboxamide isomerase [Alphaproteobacteria bacterium MarineAlpha3_Bin2]HIM25597.1 1-(5-phosphoribosyl)-5-[(5-phosphoribosylamino)methylideneamino]imidazole-4-carboxamide isomerase [Rhodospirillales bacterium]